MQAIVDIFNVGKLFMYVRLEWGKFRFPCDGGGGGEIGHWVGKGRKDLFGNRRMAECKKNAIAGS